MIRPVLDVLTWNQAAGVPGLLRTRYEDHLENRIRQIAAENDEVCCILESAEMLPRERRRAFLRAPQVASRLVACRAPHEFDSAPVAKSLVAELAASGIAVDLAGPTWTVLGDRCLDPLKPQTFGTVPAGFGVRT